MLNAVQEKLRRSAQVTTKSVGEGRSSNQPPVMAVPVSPHPVFGSIGKEGLDLEQQSIHVLDFWHKKATALCNSFSDSDFNGGPRQVEYEATHRVQWDIYRAALKAKLNSSSEAARLMPLVVRHSEYNGAELELDELKIINDALLKATAPIVSSKTETCPVAAIAAKYTDLVRRHNELDIPDADDQERRDRKMLALWRQIKQLEDRVSRLSPSSPEGAAFLIMLASSKPDSIQNGATQKIRDQACELHERFLYRAMDFLAVSILESLSDYLMPKCADPAKKAGAR